MSSASSPAPRSGSAPAAITLTGTASGVRATRATATGALTVSGLVSGTRGRPGTATGNVTLGGLATGTHGVTAVAAAAITLSGTASGAPSVRGTATGHINLGGTAVGAGTVSAVVGQWNTADVVAYQYGADEVVEWFMVTAVETKTGTAIGAITLAAAAHGDAGEEGRAAGTITIFASASGVAAPAGVDVLTEAFDTLNAWTLTGTAALGAGRTGSGLAVTGSTASAAYSLGVNESAEVTIGFAWQAVASNAAQREIMQLWSDSNATRHLRVVYTGTAAGRLEVFRDASSLGQSASSLIAPDTWYYIEVRAVLHDSTGSVTVRLNGVDVITLSNVDTRNAGTKTVFDTVRLSTAVAGVTSLWDDLYVSVGGVTFKGSQVYLNYANVMTYSTESGLSMGAAQAVAAPAGVTVGDLLIAIATLDSNIAMTASTGWTSIIAESIATPHQLAAWARIADGGADDAFAVTGNANDYCVSLLRVVNHGVATIGTDIKTATAENATASAIDPPSLDAGTSAAWLWLAIAGADTTASGQITAAPAGYTLAHPVVSTSSATGSGLAVALNAATTQTQNPGVFTNTARPWMAFTFAIPKVP